MEWAAPDHLWLGLVLLPLAALAAWGARRRRAALARVGGGSSFPPGVSLTPAPLPEGEGSNAPGRGFWSWLHPSAGVALLRGGLISAAILLLVASLGGPRWGVVAEERQSRGVDIIVALDTSRSMLADDLSPTRLAAAKEAVARLVAGLKGDRIGLVAFAGSAFLTCPLTTDYGAFGATLAETGVDTIPLGGTSLAAALKEAGRAFPRGRGGAKVLIVVSDGEDQGGGDYAAAAAELRATGVVMYCVAAGTAGGALIPLGQGEYFKDRAGAAIKTRMRADSLREIAGGPGHLADLASGPALLPELYGRELAALERGSVSSRRQRLRERFQVPLALCLALLFLEPLLGRGRKP